MNDQSCRLPEDLIKTFWQMPDKNRTPTCKYLLEDNPEICLREVNSFLLFGSNVYKRFYHIVCVSHCKISRLTLLAFVISPQIAGCGAKTDKFSKSIGGAWISKRYGLGDQKINTQRWKMCLFFKMA